MVSGAPSSASWRPASPTVTAPTAAEADALATAFYVLGPTGALLKGAPGAVDNGLWARNFVWQRFTTIGAGPTEVQKNMIADRALKLER